jgi:hypothetical protein
MNMTMKWDWGKGIVLSFVLFCSFIVWIVVQAFQENIDLVSDTYYLDELAYQTRIDDRTNLHESGLSIAFEQKDDELILKFPSAFATATGEVKFYHTSKAIFDKTFPLALNETNKQSISKKELIKGYFKVQVSWAVRDKTYYQEQEIFLR